MKAGCPIAWVGRAHSLRSGFVAVASVLLLGCGSTEGPELIPVEGTVTVAGQPVQAGSVSFRPEGEPAHSQYSPTGSIDETGRYQIFVNGEPGCPPGKYRVVVFAYEKLADNSGSHARLPQSVIPARYNNPATTPLQVEVQPGAVPQTHDLRLER